MSFGRPHSLQLSIKYLLSGYGGIISREVFGIPDSKKSNQAVSHKYWLSYLSRMLNPKKRPKVELLNDDERRLLTAKRPSQRSTGKKTSDLLEKYFVVDTTISKFLKDFSLMVRNCCYIPDKSRLSPNKVKKIEELETVARAAFLKSVYRSIYELTITETEISESMRASVKELWKEMERPENYVNWRRERSYNYELKIIREKYSKKKFQPFISFLIKLRSFQAQYYNDFFVVENGKLNAITYTNDSKDRNSYRVLSSESVQGAMRGGKLRSFLRDCEKFRFISIIKDKNDRSLDRYFFQLSRLGYLVSLALDPVVKLDEDAFFRMDEIIGELYPLPNFKEFVLDKYPDKPDFFPSTALGPSPLDKPYIPR